MGTAMGAPGFLLKFSGEGHSCRQVLQASLVGTVGPTALGLPKLEPEGLMLAGPGDGSGHSTNHHTKPVPGSAASLLAFALWVLQT